jgi:hypothetical protein
MLASILLRRWSDSLEWWSGRRLRPPPWPHSRLYANQIEYVPQVLGYFDHGNVAAHLAWVFLFVGELFLLLDRAHEVAAGGQVVARSLLRRH